LENDAYDDDDVVAYIVADITTLAHLNGFTTETATNVIMS